MYKARTEDLVAPHSLLSARLDALATAQIRPVPTGHVRPGLLSDDREDLAAGPSAWSIFEAPIR